MGAATNKSQLSKVELSTQLKPKFDVVSRRYMFNNEKVTSTLSNNNAVSMIDNTFIIADRISYMNSLTTKKQYICVKCEETHNTESEAIMHQFYEHNIKGFIN